MDFRDFVPNVCFEQIPIKNLVSNQDYQRSLSSAHVAKAAAEFDIYQIMHQTGVSREPETAATISMVCCPLKT